MKTCPKCNAQYDDENLNFCLSDGELLMEAMPNQQTPEADADSTPTMYMDSPRVTNQDWNPDFSNQTQQNHLDQPGPQNQQMYQPQYPGGQNFPMVASEDKTLATTSLVLGILSLVLMCCWLGLPLGAGALITGYIGISRANSDPETYAGKELAIIGMILGGISATLTVIFVFLQILAAIVGG
jgi:hypothetical protein